MTTAQSPTGVSVTERAISPRRAGVQVIQTIDTKPVKEEETVLLTEEQKADNPNPGLLVGTRAKLLPEFSEEDDSAGTDQSQGTESKETEKAPDKGEAKLILGKFKTQDDLGKGYTELEAHATRLAQRNMELEKAAIKPVVTQDVPIVIDKNIVEKFYEKPEEALADIAKAVTQQVRKNVTEERKADETKDAEAATKKDMDDTVAWFKETQKDISSPKYFRMIDGIAATAPGKTFKERYEFAVKEFRTIQEDARNEGKKGAVETLHETEEMKKKAVLPDLNSPKSPGGKVWKRSEIDRMIVHDPISYAKNQHAIVKALREGRVREDL